MWAFCFFSIFSQTFVFALNFKLRFQKLLGKAFMMKLLKQILVCKVVTWQPFVPKGRTWFRSGDAGTQQCSGSWIFSSWVVVAGGGTVTFVAQQGTSGFTRCSESAAVTRTFSKPARLLVPFLLLCPFPWLHAANMSSLVLSLRLLLARRTRPQCLPSADKFAWSLPVLLIIFSWQTIAVSSLTQKWHRAAATFFLFHSETSTIRSRSLYHWCCSNTNTCKFPSNSYQPAQTFLHVVKDPGNPERSLNFSCDSRVKNILGIYTHTQFYFYF